MSHLCEKDNIEETKQEKTWAIAIKKVRFTEINCKKCSLIK